MSSGCDRLLTASSLPRSHICTATGGPTRVTPGAVMLAVVTALVSVSPCGATTTITRPLPAPYWFSVPAGTWTLTLRPSTPTTTGLPPDGSESR